VFRKWETIKVSFLQRLQSSLFVWLQFGTASGELSAAGYNLDSLLERFEDTLIVLEAAWGDPESVTGHWGLVSCLQVLGQGLCAIASPAICNNPCCSNVSGPSEMLLVSGRSALCGGCRVAHYCSRDCQRQHWKQHKPVCQRLAAAAGAGAGAKT
jgi:hypothetical protein